MFRIFPWRGNISHFEYPSFHCALCSENFGPQLVVDKGQVARELILLVSDVNLSTSRIKYYNENKFDTQF